MGLLGWVANSVVFGSVCMSAGRFVGSGNNEEGVYHYSMTFSEALSDTAMKVSRDTCRPIGSLALVCVVPVRLSSCSILGSSYAHRVVYMGIIASPTTTQSITAEQLPTTEPPHPSPLALLTQRPIP